MSKKKLVVLSGAGISAESGLSTFRDTGGLWAQYRIEDVATPEAWRRNQKLVLDFYNQRRREVMNAQPNAAHKALAELEDHFDVTVITQNIDDLHERGGSKKILHLHGEIMKSRSSADYQLLYECRGEIHVGDKCELGSQLRPHVVWFGEAVPMMDAAIEETGQSENFVVVGTSLQVYPAAGLLNYSPAGAKKFLVDPNKPDIMPVRNLEMILEKASVGVPQLVRRLINDFK